MPPKRPAGPTLSTVDRSLRPGATPPSTETLERFAQVVGPDYAISIAQDMAPYLTEWRDRYMGRAAMVLRPGSTAEVARIMAIANETRTAIVPQGGNTGLVGGQIPFESGHEVVLSLSRLNRVRSLDPHGNTMTVEAGVVLEEAQKAALAVNRIFPLSLSAEGSCQIGGNLATNAGGVQVLAYGNARDLVLGLEVVLADGRVWDGLRGLRKDNTGYDLKNLFVGSEGTLGIITAAVLKLYPRPAEQVTALLGVESLEKMVELFSLVSSAGGSRLTAFEFLPRIGVDFVLTHIPGTADPLGSPHPWYALIELSGANGDGQARAVAEAVLEEALDDQLISGGTIAGSLAQAHALWRLRHTMSEVQKHEGGSIKHDVSVPIGRIPEFIRRANDLVQLMIPRCRPVPFGHFGDGNVHYNISQPLTMDKGAFLAQWDAVTAAVHEIVVDLGGSVSAEHGVGRMKRDLLAHVKSPVELDLMQRIKQAFDPKGILNPGKVL